MSDAVDPHEELAGIAAALRTYLEWHIDAGAHGVPRLPRRAHDARAHAAPATDAQVKPAPGEATAGAPMAIPAPAAPLIAAPRMVTTSRASVVDAVGPGPGVDPGPGTGAPADVRRVHLDTLAAQVATCTKCDLAMARTNTVFARGNPLAAVCFIGEAPGADEDAQGEPFVGRAGQLLDRMIAAMGLSTERDVYICNIVKCRPPENRRPTPDESATCIPYLHEQLATVRPKVIVALGNTAVSALLGTTLGITRVRGQWKLYKGTTLVMPTYHPSYLLRPSPQQIESKRQAWEDLQLVMKELGLPHPRA